MAVLETMDLAVTPRGAELRVLHGELLLEAGRRDEARAQFERALAAPLVRDAEERALVGLASASTQVAAQAAWRKYLERFPRGRFVTQARRALDAE